MYDNFTCKEPIYEYEVISSGWDSQELSERINKLAEEGWLMVMATQSESETSGPNRTVYFTRERKESK